MPQRREVTVDDNSLEIIDGHVLDPEINRWVPPTFPTRKEWRDA